MNLKITPPPSEYVNSTSQGTTFELNGEPLSDVYKCVVRYEVDNIVTAELTINVTPGTIEANAMLSEMTLREAAKERELILVSQEELYTLLHQAQAGEHMHATVSALLGETG